MPTLFKTALTLLASFIFLSPVQAEQASEELKLALNKMQDYLDKENEEHQKRKTKIYDYYIKNLKSMKELAQKKGETSKVTDINKELIKIMNAKNALGTESESISSADASSAEEDDATASTTTTSVRDAIK